MLNDKMGKITDEMSNFICEKICEKPIKTKCEEELMDTCSKCRLGQYLCDIDNVFRTKELENIYEFLSEYENGDVTAGFIMADNMSKAAESLEKTKARGTSCSSVKVNEIQFDEDGICKAMTRRNIAIEDVVNATAKIVKEKCIEKARKIWTKEQVGELIKIFDEANF